MGEDNLIYLSMNGHEIDKNNQLICTVQMITITNINGLALMRVFDESVIWFDCKSRKLNCEHNP